MRICVNFFLISARLESLLNHRLAHFMFGPSVSFSNFPFVKSDEVSKYG